MDIQKNIANVIRTLKESRGISIAEFSEELEISCSALQTYLSGSGNPNATTIEHLARKLGVDVSVLVSGALSDRQFEVLLKMMDNFKLLYQLSPAQRRRFAELLLEMLLLWDSGDSDE
ncbi:MAG: helix-turn-helix domain-containing protein [Oscillospiraceae bacterium]|nr:helix-turn-helix domain-containing protein [Oscillospiraceae bacterium]